MAHDSSVRNELAAFLRSRRERLKPEDVDLRGYARRRTPGLRREEVANLAGIGVTWYTWLEQGRDVHPSPAVAAALANALRLTPLERSHLFGLLRREDSNEQAHASASLESLARQFPWPAFIRDDAWDLIYSNTAARTYFGDFGPVIDGRANLMTYLFLNKENQFPFRDWKDVATRSVAQFRRMNGACAPESRAGNVIQHLIKVSPRFKSCWDSFVVTDFFVGQRVLRDSNGVETLFTYATLTSPTSPWPMLSLYVPVDNSLSDGS
jgi:transcriptional regulator with XRE-family HTH domain